VEEENQAHEGAGELSPTRRSFYIKFIYGAMSLIGVALAAPAAIYLLFPPKVRKENEWEDAADLSQIPTGTPTEISFQHNRVDGWKVTSKKATAWVVNQPDGQPIAFSPPSTHFFFPYLLFPPPNNS